MRYAVIENGTVVNMIEVSDPTEFPSMHLVRTDEAGIGWLYDAQTGQFARPANDPEVVVRTLSKPKFKMRIPMQKYAQLRTLSAQDDVVWAFMEILNDPTLTEVELDSLFLGQALDYLIAVYPNLVTAADKSDWLA